MARVLVVAALVLGVLALAWGLPSAPPRPQADGDDEGGGGGDGGDGGDDDTSIVEAIRKIIREGSEELGIPVLDPYQLNSLSTSIEKYRSYEVVGSLNKVVATGLADFDFDLVSRYMVLYLDLAATVKIPLLEAEGGYDFDALLGEVVHLYGAGNFQLKITELEIKIFARIFPRATYGELRNLTTTINGVDFEFQLDGLLEGGLVDGIFNLAVNQLAKIIFREQKDVLEQYLTELLYEPISSVVAQFSYQQLVCQLLGILCPTKEVGDTNYID